MFIKKSFIDEIASSLEENMSILAAQPELRAKERKSKVIEYLSIASELLDQTGLEKEAIVVTNVLKKIANEFGSVKDPASPKSSEQALKNLKEKGWMFNPGPDDEADIEDELIEEK